MPRVQHTHGEYILKQQTRQIVTITAIVILFVSMVWLITELVRSQTFGMIPLFHQACFKKRVIPTIKVGPQPVSRWDGMLQHILMVAPDGLEEENGKATLSFMSMGQRFTVVTIITREMTNGIPFHALLMPVTILMRVQI